MIYGEALFHCGVAVMCVAAGIAALAAVVFSVSGKRLKKTLDMEYGEKRHG